MELEDSNFRVYYVESIHIFYKKYVTETFVKFLTIRICFRISETSFNFKIYFQSDLRAFI